MHAYLMICVVTKYCSMMMIDPSVTGCAFFAMKQGKMGNPTPYTYPRFL